MRAGGRRRVSDTGWASAFGCGLGGRIWSEALLIRANIVKIPHRLRLDPAGAGD
jgi:hypothetical protein